MSGKVFVVIGGTKGLGLAIAESLALKQAKRVIVVGRSFESRNSKLEFVKSDLKLMKTAKSLFSTDPVLSDALPSVNELIFTNGILCGMKREETSEKIEVDMAVSYLSRLAILDSILSPDSKRNSNLRVWNMGYPGANMTPYDINDLNGIKKYSIMNQHGLTVIGNEAIVHVFKNIIPIFGLNPGVIKTDIRKIIHKNNVIGRALEWMIEKLNPTAQEYGNRVSSVICSNEYDNKSGILFNQKMKEIKRMKWLTDENSHLFVEKSRELIDYALKN